GGVDVIRKFRMHFGDRIDQHGAGLRAGADIDDDGRRIIGANALQDVHRAAAIDIDVKEGILQGIRVRGVAGAIKDVILADDHRVEKIEVADVVDDDADFSREVSQIGDIAAALGHQRINHGHFAAHFETADRQVAADESKTSQNENALVFEWLALVTLHFHH